MENVIKISNEKITTKDGREFTKVVGGFGEDKPIITDKQVAELLGYSKGARQVRVQVLANQSAFEEYHIIDLKNKVSYSSLLTLGYAKASITQAKCIYGFSWEGFLLYLNKTEYPISEELKSFIQCYFGCSYNVDNIFPKRKEIEFFNILNPILNELGIEIINQYKVGLYKIDGYIQSLNIAIEYDENGHADYTYEQHEGRQKEIEKELGCKFIRVTDEYDYGTAIGMVIKNILN